jgi:hypothetical protein
MARTAAAAPAQTAAAFTAADLAMFARLRIPPELLTEAHVKRVSDREARDEYGITGPASNDMAGVVFPYFSLATGERATCRVRRDNPEIEAGKEKNKYISAYGDRKHLYFPPGSAAKLQDPNTPIALVEAEKSSLALTAWAERTGMNPLAVGMGGCWGWKGRIGKLENAHGERVDEYGAVSDLDCVNGRKLYVLLDANAATKPKVQQARAALIRELTKRNCEVLTCNLPITDGVNGPDDYIAACGDKAMTEVFANATAGAGGNWRELFHTYEDFLNAPPLRFSIEGFAQEAGIGLIGGLVGQGKTLLMLSMVQAMLEQRPLFGCELFKVPRPAERVLYLVPESALGPFWSRIKLFHLEEHVRADRLLVRTLASKEQVALTDPRILKAAEGADIFLDTAVRFMNGAENDVENAKVFADTLFRLLAAGARTITGAHHAPKGFENQDRMTLENVLRGSGDIGAMLSTCWGVRQVDANSNRLYVENLKARDFQTCGAFVLEGRPHLDLSGRFKVVEAPGTAGELRDYLHTRGAGAPSTPDKGEKLQRAIEMRAAGSSLREIASALGISKSAVSKWLAEYDGHLSTNSSTSGHRGQSSIPEGGKTQ